MIKINNLTKKYKEKYAVNNLNLEIKSGELFSLLGTNGCRKDDNNQNAINIDITY